MAIVARACKTTVGGSGQVSSVTVVAVMVFKDDAPATLPLLLQLKPAEELFGKEVCDKLPVLTQMQLTTGGVSVKLSMEIL